MNYSDTHREVVEACLKGDKSAQFKLYELYSKGMYNVCIRLVKNEYDAEDILQNSFVDIFMKLHSFKFESSIGAWIKRIVVNNSINFLRSKRLQFEELNLRKMEDTPGESKEINQSYDVAVVKRAIQELPEGYRVVFTLYLLEGYDHSEIGEILNISASTSKSQYSRAKKKLKEIIGSQLLQTSA